MMLGTCHVFSPSCRKADSWTALCTGMSGGTRSCRSHCWTAIAKKAETKLSVRLNIHIRLTGIAYDAGTNIEEISERESAVAEEFISRGPVELTLATAIVREESCREIRASSRFEASPGSCCSQVYDSIVNAVTTAENRPAYPRNSSQIRRVYIAYALTKTRRLLSSSFQLSMVSLSWSFIVSSTVSQASSSTAT